ncbi:MAG: sulfurtransferase [Candidatus Thiodiazotropha sp. (ex Semelilucina semeliformis)]|nr:sulfurtransferase [Candidatus Thiodiazotropha sp. (ex Semelilucina semeliformis)]
MLRIMLAGLLSLIWIGTLSAQPLVSPSWLHDNRQQENLVILDLQETQGFQRHHIPGAVNTGYGQWRTDKKGTPKLIPPVSQLERLIGSLGIDNDSQVVLVSLGASAGDLTSAARIYWTFKALGHDKISILDGGLVAYAQSRRYPLERGENKPRARTFKANLRSEMVPTSKEVKHALDNGSMAVDNRSRAEYLGIYAGSGRERTGSLPNAVNLSYDWLTVNGSGKLHSTENLQRIYKASDVPLKGSQINYCHTGHRASLGWFVSHEILGNTQAKLYDGSTEEWAVDKKLPMDLQVRLDP